MNDCYINNFRKYNWLFFYDIDEFIHLNNYSNVKNFLTNNKFNKCPLIYLNLVCHTDNGLLYYENKSLFERFPEIAPNTKLGGRNLEVKFILKGHIPRIAIENIHTCNENIINCNGFGHKNKINFINSTTTEPDIQYYYIDHFYSKSTEEFINKLLKGNACNVPKNFDLERINKYFNQSNITKDKIELIEKRTGYSLKDYKKKIN